MRLLEITTRIYLRTKNNNNIEVKKYINLLSIAFTKFKNVTVTIYFGIFS